MNEPSTSQDTGALTEAQAASAFADMLDGDVQSDDGEALEGETSQTEAEPEGQEPDDEVEEVSDEADGDDEQTEQPATYRVKIDGEEVEVTLDEALKGYQRERDYTRKTQEVAQQRKALVEQEASFAAERERARNLLAVLETRLADTDDTEDLEALRYDNPGEYAARVAEKLQRAELAKAAAAERQRLEEQDKATQAQQRQAEVAEEMGKLLTALPAWKDPAVAQREYAQILETIKSVGYTEQDLTETMDHRNFLLAKKAAAYDALKAKSPQIKPKVSIVQVARPGTTTAPASKVTEETRAKQRLAKTGKEADAAALFLKMLG